MSRRKPELLIIALCVIFLSSPSCVLIPPHFSFSLFPPSAVWYLYANRGRERERGRDAQKTQIKVAERKERLSFALLGSSLPFFLLRPQRRPKKGDREGTDFFKGDRSSSPYLFVSILRYLHELLFN